MSLHLPSFPASDLWAGKRRLIAPILAGRNQQRGSKWMQAQPALAPSDEGAGIALAMTEGEKPVPQNRSTLFNPQGALSLFPSAATLLPPFSSEKGKGGYEAT